MTMEIGFIIERARVLKLVEDMIDDCKTSPFDASVETGEVLERLQGKILADQTYTHFMEAYHHVLRSLKAVQKQTEKDLSNPLITL